MEDYKKILNEALQFKSKILKIFILIFLGSQKRFGIWVVIKSTFLRNWDRIPGNFLYRKYLLKDHDPVKGASPRATLSRHRLFKFILF